MIKPILKNYQPDLGDILCGHEYIAGPANVDLIDKALPILIWNGGNPWEALSRFHIDESFSKDFLYECPYSNNMYYWCIPTHVVLRGDITKYVDKSYENTYEWDAKYHAEGMRRDSEISSIDKAFLGHGYTAGTLPRDGNGEIQRMLIELDNGDALLCACWVWFNK